MVAKHVWLPYFIILALVLRGWLLIAYISVLLHIHRVLSAHLRRAAG